MISNIVELGVDGQPIAPDIILAYRSGRKQGIIPNIEQDSIQLAFHLNEPDEISFTVYKYMDGVECPMWDDIKDLRLVYVPYYKKWYEIDVTVDEDDKTIKSVDGLALCESELSQLLLDEVEINTEGDIDGADTSRIVDGKESYDTVFYDPSIPKLSLLNRVLSDKASHYEIYHIDKSIAGLSRQFSWNNSTIYDALMEVAEEISCLFRFGESDTPGDGKIHRTISAYDLLDYCEDCGTRDAMNDGVCPKCGSRNIRKGYGEESNVFLSTENFGQSITYETDMGSVKNCFKLVGGDDYMTATIANCLPSGDPKSAAYLWYLSDELRADMSPELQQKLKEYDELYEKYEKTYAFPIADHQSEIDAYNELIAKYQAYDENLKPVETPINGYSNLTSFYYDLENFRIYLQTSLLPAADAAEQTTAVEQAALLNNSSMSPIGLSEGTLRYVAKTTTDSAVKSYANVYIDTSRYEVSILESSFDSDTKVWTGTLSVKSYTDENDTANTPLLTIVFNEDGETYIEQKLEKAMNKMNTKEVGIVPLFKKDLDAFRNDIKNYSLDGLNLLADVCDACIDIMVGEEISEDTQYNELYDVMYMPYVNKRTAIEEEKNLRESELATVDALYTWVSDQQTDVYNNLHLRTFVGEDLWAELSSFRRDDIYDNSNYVSDGYEDDNAKVIARALEFIETAKKELKKAATLQHTISGSFVDFMLIRSDVEDEGNRDWLATHGREAIVTDLDEYIRVARPTFADMLKHWDVGNWLHIEVDEKVYKLRMTDYTVDFGSVEDIDVTFSDVIVAPGFMSDVQSILNSAKSISTSYSSVKRQAEQGNAANVAVTDFVNNGLDLTNKRIVNTADNQSLVMNDRGMTMRRRDDYGDEYYPEQTKIINEGIYYTKDNWKTANAGLGHFIYIDPETGEEVDGYGVIAETVVGKLILGEKLKIYGSDGTNLDDTTGYITDIDENGILVHRKHEENNGVRITDQVDIVRDGDSVASFSDVVRIGKSGETRAEIDYHSLQLVDYDGETYFYVSDLRNPDGTITDSFIGDGETAAFNLTLLPEGDEESVTVLIDDAVIPSSEYSIVDNSGDLTPGAPPAYIYFNTAPSSGAVIKVKYLSTQALKPKAFTFGVRKDDGSKVGLYSVAMGDDVAAIGTHSHAVGNNAVAYGNYSHAEGIDVRAIGSYSHAYGRGTVTLYDSQTAIGKYNNNQSANLFEVGNGTSTTLSNAFAVDRNGNIEAKGNVTDGSGNVLSLKADASDLTSLIQAKTFLANYTYRNTVANTWQYTGKSFTIPTGYAAICYVLSNYASGACKGLGLSVSSSLPAAGAPELHQDTNSTHLNRTCAFYLQAGTYYVFSKRAAVSSSDNTYNVQGIQIKL